MKLSVSTIRRPSGAVEPFGHWNGVDQRAEATCSLKPVAPDATAGTASNVRAARREMYPYGRERRRADRHRGNCKLRMRELLSGVVEKTVYRSNPGCPSRSRSPLPSTTT